MYDEIGLELQLKLESEESKKILLCKFQADTVVLESLRSSKLFHSPPSGND